MKIGQKTHKRLKINQLKPKVRIAAGTKTTTMQKMKNQMLSLLFVALALVSAGAQTRTLEKFDELSVTGEVDVILKSGAPAVSISTAGIDPDDVNVEVREGVLRIKVLKSLLKSDDRIKVVVSHGQLRKIRALAGANISGREPIRGDQLALKAGSGAKVKLKVAVNKLEASASEGGEIEVTGTAETQDVKVASGGQYEGYELATEYAYVGANTGGVAKITAHQLLEANANTGGVIEYKGNPAKTRFREHLTGKIREG
ncbi:MAG: DUF2807 domain-containing protein [Bacteroidetes bacterium]|nr:MAG: DUF2807 domain-containing protein [Bacteroidota bacterium]